MKMRINSAIKLFFAILGSCAIVLAINGIVGHISFNRGFIGYLNEQGMERMRSVLPRFEQAYRQHGNWDYVYKNVDEWFYLMSPASHPYAEHGLPEEPLPVSDQTGAVFRMALLDAQGNLLFGNPDAVNNTMRLPIVVEDNTVGWLTMIPFQKAISGGDMRFYQQQIRGWWLMGVASVFIAALLAWVSSRALIKRVKKLTDTIHFLAAGDYSQRVQINREDELGVLGSDVNHLADTLENVENNRRSFMADISHELRTPLAVMRAEVEAMQDGIRPLNEMSMKLLQSEIQQLGKLINDFHDLSVTQSGKFSYRFENIDLNYLLQGIVEGMDVRVHESNLSTHYKQPGAPLFIKGDERRLYQLFSNLMENAIRYTAQGGQILVSLERCNASFCRVIVEDSAPGVNPEYIDHLFERFFRVEASRNRSSGGSGLGLAICRNIVEAHSGSIHAESSTLGGLRIVISLPMESASC